MCILAEGNFYMTPFDIFLLIYGSIGLLTVIFHIWMSRPYLKKWSLGDWVVCIMMGLCIPFLSWYGFYEEWESGINNED